VFAIGAAVSALCLPFLRPMFRVTQVGSDGGSSGSFEARS
jgi:hypothetical protein